MHLYLSVLVKGTYCVSTQREHYCTLQGPFWRWIDCLFHSREKLRSLARWTHTSSFGIVANTIIYWSIYGNKRWMKSVCKLVLVVKLNKKTCHKWIDKEECVVKIEFSTKLLIFPQPTHSLTALRHIPFALLCDLQPGIKQHYAYKIQTSHKYNPKPYNP